MSDPREESLTLLRRIAESNERIERLLLASAPPPVADAKDLDGKWGDEEVKFTPKNWTGTPIKGKRMSECPAEALDLLAETFDYFAAQAEEKNELYNGKPVAPYKRKSAARARGWAARIRAGKVRQAPPEDGWGEDRHAASEDAPW